MAPAAVELIDPVDRRVDTNTPLFKWNASTSDDVVSYRLQVTSGGSFSGPLDFEVLLTGGLPGLPPPTQYQLKTADSLADDVYRWRVIASDRANNTATSSTAVFTLLVIEPVTVPVLVEPQQGAFVNDPTPLFDWEPSSGDPFSYRLQVVTSGDPFTTPFHIDTLITGDGGPPPSQYQVDTADSLVDRSYAWLVVAADLIPTTATSQTRTFILDTTPPTRPEGLTREITGDNVTSKLTWSASTDPVPPTGVTGDESGVDFYRVVITQVAGNKVVQSGDVPHAPCAGGTCEFVLSFQIASGLYTASVTAFDRATNASAPGILEFQEGPVGAVQNLEVVDPAYFESALGGVGGVRNPSFQWNPPAVLPDSGDLARGGIDTYLVALTGDPTRAPGFSIPFTPYTDGGCFQVECFLGASKPNPDATGDACTGFIGSGDVIRLTVIGPVPDGTHVIGIRVRPTAGQLGPLEQLTFSVDATAPPAPALLEPPDGANVDVKRPTFAWIQVVDAPFSGDLTYTLEIARGDQPGTGASGQFLSPVFTADGIANTAVSSGGVQVVRFLLPSDLGAGDFLWHVLAVDRAQNTGDFSADFRFTRIDRVVDLRLVVGKDPVGPEEVFTLSVVVDPNGQSVNTGAAYVDFDPVDVQVLSIAPGPGVNLAASGFDNVVGTIDIFVDASSKSAAVPFVLAQITFRAKEPAVLAKVSSFDFSFTGGRTTDVVFQGAFAADAASVLRAATGDVVTIVKPQVDLRLGIHTGSLTVFENFGRFVFARDQVFQVVVRVEPDPLGTGVTAVDALLNFDTRKLRILSVDTSSSLLTEDVEVAIDNTNGTVDISSATKGNPVTGDFILAAVNFQVKQATQSLGVGFHTEHPRASDAAVNTVSVLRDLIGFPAEIALELRITRFASFEADVTVQVRPNGNPISAVDAHLDLLDGSPQDLIILRVIPGQVLERELDRDFNNTFGTARYSAATRGVPLIGEFEHATLEVFTSQIALADQPATDSIELVRQHPRLTRADSDGVPISGDQLRLVNLAMRADRPGALPNLVKLTPDTGDTGDHPTFQWDPPIRFPVAGIKTYQVSITEIGDPPNEGDFNDFRAFSHLECLDDALSPIGSGDDCFRTGDTLRTVRLLFSVSPEKPLRNGSYLIRARAVDHLDKTGDASSLAFSVNAPTPAGQLLVFPTDDLFTKDTTPEFRWALNTGDVTEYILQVVRVPTNIAVGPYFIQRLLAHPTDRFQVDAGDALPDAAYQWRTIARDFAKNESVSETRTFRVDTARPPATALVSPGSGDLLNTRVVTFRWQLGTDAFRYHLEVASGNSFNGTTIVATADILHPTIQASVTLPADGKFAWRVGVEDLASNFAKTGDLEVRSFDVDTVPPQPVQLIEPADNLRTNVTKPLFRWTQSTSDDIAGYRLQVVTSGGNIDAGPYKINRLVVDTDTGDGNVEFQAVAGLPDSLYTWRVLATDLAGNTADSLTRRVFTVDTTPPVPPVLTEPADNLFTNDARPLFVWNASPSADIDKYQLQVVSGDFGTGPIVLIVDLAHPTTQLQTTADLPDATYSWTVIAFDTVTVVGPNAAASATRTFTVDTVAPAAVTLRLPGSDDFIKDTTPLFDWDASASNDVVKYELQVVQSGDPFQAPFAVNAVLTGSLPAGPATQFETTGDLADNKYLWRVIAEDRAANTAESAVRPFVVDTKRPTTPTNLEEVTAGDETERVFQWEGSTDEGAGVSHYPIRIVGPTQVITSADDSAICASTCVFTTPPLIPGEYDIFVGAQDFAGNISTGEASVLGFRAGPKGAVQNLRVLDPIFFEAALGGVVNTPNPRFGWEPPLEVPNPPLVTYEASIDGSAFIVFTGDPFVATCFDLTTGSGDDCSDVTTGDRVEIRVAGIDIADGTHTLTVRGVDTLGVRSLEVTAVFTVDTAPPQPAALVFPEVDDLLNTRTINFRWQRSTSDDIAAYILQVSSGDTFSNANIVATRRVDDPTTGDTVLLSGDGTYTWRVVAEDSATNTSDSAVRAFRIDTVAPDAATLTSPADGTFTNDDTPLFDWDPSSSEDVVRFELEVVVSGDAFQAPFAITAVLTGSLPTGPATQFQAVTVLADGFYQWRVRAVDEATNTTSSGIFEFGVDTTPPSQFNLLSPGSGDPTNDKTPFFDWEPSTSDDVTTYRIEVTSGDGFSGDIDVTLTGDLPAGPVSEFQATVDLLDTTYLWRVTAGDRVPNTTSSVTRSFAVDTIAPNAPTGLAREDTGDNATRRFRWDRSVDPVPTTGTTGDESGPAQYTVAITRTFDGLSVETGLVQNSTCSQCEFVPSVALSTSQHRIDVTPVDDAGNTGSTATLVFAEGLLDQVVDLRAVEFVFTADRRGAVFNVDTPKFRWTRPDQLPLAGFGTYEVAIEGYVHSGAVITRATTTILAFTPFTGGAFVVACFDSANRPIGVGANCATATAAGDQIQITVVNVSSPAPDGAHRLFVRMVDSENVKGPAVTADFTVDTTGPAIIGLTKTVSDEDATPTFDWTATDDLTDVAFQRVHIQSSGDLVDVFVPSTPTLVAPSSGGSTNNLTPLFDWTVALDDITESGDLVYIFEIGTGEQPSTDDFSSPTLRLLVTGVTELTGDALDTGDYVRYLWHVKAVDRSGNIGSYSELRPLFIDTTAPTTPDLVAPGTGARTVDTTPTFAWTSVSDPSGVTYQLGIGSGDQTANTGSFVHLSGYLLPANGTQLTLDAADALGPGVYTWHVRALDGAGNFGEFSTARTITVVVDVFGPPAPTLLSPISGVTGDDQTPTFDWAASGDEFNNPVTYLLEIATGSEPTTGGAFDSLVFSADGITNTQYTLADLDALDTGDFVWRVSAIDAIGNTGYPSAGANFTVVADSIPPTTPVLVSPGSGDQVDDRTLTFTWTPAVDSNRVTYTLELASSADRPETGGAFDVLQFTADGITGTALTVPESSRLENTGDYSWRIQAVDEFGNTGDYSTPFTFTLVPDVTGPSPPTPVEPASGEVTDDPTPTFNWTTGDDSNRVTSYGLEIADTGDPATTGGFSGPVFTADGIAATDFTLPFTDPLGAGDYLWHIRAFDEFGNTGDFSVVFTFTVDTDDPSSPVLVLPLAAATSDDTTPTFKWEQVTGDQTAVTYTLRIWLGSADVGTLLFVTGDIPQPSGVSDVVFTLPTANALVNTGGHTWQVRAEDAAANTGPFTSRVLSIVPDTTAPGTPEAVSPGSGDGTVNSKPTFSWTQVTGDTSGVTYTLDIGSGDQATTGAFVSPVVRVEGISDNPTSGGLIQYTLKASEALSPGGYVWRVQARDGVGNTGDFSSPRPLTILPDTTPPTTVTLLTPALGDTADSARPLFNWTEATDNVSSVTYHLQVAETGDLRRLVINLTGLTDSQVRPGVQLSGGLHAWQVLAEDAVGNTGDYAAGSFTVVATPAGLKLLFPFQILTADSTYTPTFKWQLVTEATSYELSVDNGPFRDIGLGIASGDDVLISSDTLTLGSHHVFQARAVQAGSTFRGGIATLFFNDLTTGGGTSVTVRDEDFLPLGDHGIQGSGLDTVDNIGDPADGPLPFRVVQVAFSLEPPFQNVSVPGGQGEVIVRIVPGGQPLDGAIFSIDFDPALTLEAIVAEPGVSITGDSVTGDFTASFAALTGREDSFDVATLRFIAPQVSLRPTEDNVVFVNSGGRKTVGVFQGVETTAALKNAIIKANAPPVANAGPDQSLNVAGNPSVNLNGTGSSDPNSGDAITFSWTQIGGPSVSLTGADTATPSFTTAGNGTYLFQLAVSDGDATSTDTVVVTKSTPSVGGGGAPPPPPVNEAPTADAGADQSVNEGQTVTLDGSGSSDPDGDTITFSWGQTAGPLAVTLAGASTTSPSFSAPDNGTYSFQLVVNDGEEDSDADTVDVVVSNVAPTIVNVSASPSTLTFDGGNSVISISASDPAGNNDPLLHSFDCDNNGAFDISNQASNSATCSFTEDDVGANTVNVRVDDQDGGVTDSSTTVTVPERPVNQPPDADAGDNQTADEGSTVRFDGTASSDDDGAVVSYAWDFGDGESGVGATTTHIYRDNADFEVTLVVTDDEGGTGDDTTTVSIENVDPTVAAGDDLTAAEGDSVLIAPTLADAGLDDTHTAEVDWDDGTGADDLGDVAALFSAQHVFGDDDAYDVTVTVEDDDGGVGEDTLTITVTNVAPQVNAGADLAAVEDDTVLFNGSFTDPGTDDTHDIEWDFGDGENASGTLTPTHAFDQPGEFTVTLTVEDDDGGIGTDTLVVVVTPRGVVIEGLSAQLNLSTTSPVPPETVEVTAIITNTSNAANSGIVLTLFVKGVAEVTFPAFDLDAGESRALSHSIARTVEGIYPVGILEQVRAFVIEGARFVGSDFRVEPAIAAVGNRIKSSVTITNEGAVLGSAVVSIIIDDVRFDRPITLVPGETIPVAEILQVTRPLTGLGAPGPHRVTVEIDGRPVLGARRYTVARPAIVSRVPREPDFEPGTTAVRDARGNVLTIQTGGRISFRPGSITLSLPILGDIGTRIASFVDTTSGFSLLERNIRVPIFDPLTFQPLLRLEGRLRNVLEVTAPNVPPTGIIETLSLITEPRSEDLSADDPDVGTLTVEFNAGLELLPEGVNVEMTIKKELREEDRTSVELAARALPEARIVANEAGTITVETTNLAADDIGEVEITIRASSAWIFRFGTDNVRLAHVSTNGDVELVKPVCTPTADFSEFICVGKTQKGFSEFSLLALGVPPPAFVTSNLVVAPAAVEPGVPVQIRLDVVNEGLDIGTFSAILRMRGAGQQEFEPVDVQEITLEAGESGTVTFTVLQEDEDRYEVDVEGLPGFFDVAKQIIPADLSFADPKIFLRGVGLPLDAVVAPEDPLEIRMEVFNAGEEDGRTEIALRINGAIRQKQFVTVPGEGSNEVVFDFVPPAPGILTFELVFLAEQLETKSVSVIVEVPVTEARFSLGRLDISPTEVFRGDQVAIGLQVTNIGELEGGVRIVLLVDGDEVDDESLQLEGLLGGGVSFSITAPEEPGTYTVELQGEVLLGDPDFPVVPLTGTFIVKEILEVPEPVVERMTLEPEIAQVGEPVEVILEVSNPSNEVEARRLLMIRLADQAIDREIVLGPGETETLTFTLTAPDEPGTYEVTVDGIVRTLTVEGVAAPAELNLVEDSLSIRPLEVEPEQVVIISVSLRNDGDEPGVTDVVLLIRGQEVDTERVRVPGGEERRVEFQITRDEVGEYDVEVVAADAVDVRTVSGTYEVVPPPPPAVPLSALTIQPETVEAGEAVTITVDVTNEGETSTTRNVALFVDGDLVEEREIILDALEKVTVTFTVVEEEAGVHSVTIENLRGRFEVTVAPPPAAVGGGIMLILIIVVLIVVLGGGGVDFLVLRKKKQGAPP